MTFTTENIFFIGSFIVLVSIIISKTGYRFGIPTLLLFLFTGMAFGSEGLGMHFDSPARTQFIGMIALSVILFSGGMDTKFKEIKSIIGPGVLLSTVGVVLTTALTGAFIYGLSRWSALDIQLSLMVSMLLAATMSSTDSASVFNLLRTQGIGLKNKLRPILELESGSNDPMAYMLTIALMEVVVSGTQMSVPHLLLTLSEQFVFGGLFGYLAGRLGVWLINRINLPNASLYPVLLLSIIFITFTLTDMLRGNGYLAVYIAGLVVGNSSLSYRKEMSTFLSGLTWLLQIVLFITLGLLVNPSEMLDVGIVSLAIGVFMIFIARPLSVFLCLVPYRSMPARAKVFLSWVGLRGAVPIIFATYPLINNVEGASMLFNIVFFITIVSLTLQGTTISLLARKLKLDMPEEKTGNEFGVEIPEELDSQLYEVVLTDEMFAAGSKLSEMNIPEGTLVMMVKRGKSVIVPNGRLTLEKGDILLCLSKNRQ
ncbi:MAG: potassium/proton antiporter [Prevotella sp.]|uniref:potassium/proton antiporter n=1 Tax=Prevotella sp. TaxID=59823 RepID=UPI002A27F77D|nr:potassium/proton antiporter [Prevotella sp.]MDD7317394.1 potassium/proton antiporter [Prevotellaceae bacterium]MDY4019492.1 potassium/proton antiporter [Prevotella sp.]